MAQPSPAAAVLAAVPGGLAPPAIPLDTIKLRALGQKLGQDLLQYEKDRRIAELQWMKNLRQFKGIYDPEIESQLDVNRSRAYPKMTRVKCVSMLARLSPIRARCSTMAALSFTSAVATSSAARA